MDAGSSDLKQGEGAKRVSCQTSAMEDLTASTAIFDARAIVGRSEGRG